MTTAIDRVSLELTNRCGKGCAFCYNGSKPGGATHWTGAEVIAFATDCAAHGVAALSLGGGEPLDHPDVFDVLTALDGVMFRSLTTHGLHLDAHLSRLLASRPDKVHLSIHQPGHPPEVDRVIEQVATLADHGVKSGVNLLVARSALASAAAAARRLAGAGIGPDRIVYLPMRGRDTPSADELAAVAGTARFQSMTCLLTCGRSPRFASVAWDRTAAWCSYTTSRRRLPTLDRAGLGAALDGLGLRPCG